MLVVLTDEVASDDTTAGSSKMTSYTKEFYALLNIAWPVVITQAGQILIAPIAVFFCGHLSSMDLDGVAMANSIFSATGQLMCTGMATACDTLFSQIYGSSQRHTLGITLQRSLLIMVLAALCCVAVHINTTPMLILMKQDPVVAQLAGDYMLIMIPGVISCFLYTVLTKYIQCQSIVYPTMVISNFALLLCAGLHVLLVRYLNLGLTGSALAQTLSHVFILMSTIMYIRLSKVYEGTWCALSVECLLDWGTFTKLGASGLAMLSSVGLTWEVGIILAGLLDTTQQGAQAVVFNVRLVTFVISLGTGIAASIRMGQSLGAGDGTGAKQSAHVAFMITIVVSVFTGGLCYLLRYQIPTWISDDGEVVEVATDALPIVALFFVLDGIYAIYSTSFRSSGRQVEGAVVQLIGYAIGNAMGVYLMFYKHYGIKGFWIALSSTLLLVNLVYTILFVKTDWDDQVQKAKNRIQSSGNSKPLLDKKVNTKNSLTLDEYNNSEPLLGKKVDRRVTMDPYGNIVHLATAAKTRLPSEDEYFNCNQTNINEKCSIEMSNSASDDDSSVNNLEFVDSGDDNNEGVDDDDDDDNDDNGADSLTCLIIQRLLITVTVLSMLIVSVSYRCCYENKIYVI